MKFLISVYSDDETEIDYSEGLLSAANAVSFINGWQAQQEAAQHSVQSDECPTCAGLGFVNDDRGRRGVDCSDCNGSGIRR